MKKNNKDYIETCNRNVMGQLFAKNIVANVSLKKVYKILFFIMFFRLSLSIYGMPSHSPETCKIIHSVGSHPQNHISSGEKLLKEVGYSTPQQQRKERNPYPDKNDTSKDSKLKSVIAIYTGQGNNQEDSPDLVFHCSETPLQDFVPIAIDEFRLNVLDVKQFSTIQKQTHSAGSDHYDIFNSIQPINSIKIQEVEESHEININSDDLQSRINDQCDITLRTKKNDPQNTIQDQEIQDQEIQDSAVRESGESENEEQESEHSNSLNNNISKGDERIINESVVKEAKAVNNHVENGGSFLEMHFNKQVPVQKKRETVRRKTKNKDRLKNNDTIADDEKTNKGSNYSTPQKQDHKTKKSTNKSLLKKSRSKLKMKKEKAHGKRKKKSSCGFPLNKTIGSENYSIHYYDYINHAELERESQLASMYAIINLLYSNYKKIIEKDPENDVSFSNCNNVFKLLSQDTQMQFAQIIYCLVERAKNLQKGINQSSIIDNSDDNIDIYKEHIENLKADLIKYIKDISSNTNGAIEKIFSQIESKYKAELDEMKNHYQTFGHAKQDLLQEIRLHTTKLETFNEYFFKPRGLKDGSFISITHQFTQLEKASKDIQITAKTNQNEVDQRLTAMNQSLAQKIDDLQYLLLSNNKLSNNKEETQINSYQQSHNNKETLLKMESQYNDHILKMKLAHEGQLLKMEKMLEKKLDYLKEAQPTPTTQMIPQTIGGSKGPSTNSTERKELIKKTQLIKNKFQSSEKKLDDFQSQTTSTSQIEPPSKSNQDSFVESSLQFIGFNLVSLTLYNNRDKLMEEIKKIFVMIKSRSFKETLVKMKNKIQDSFKKVTNFRSKPMEQKISTPIKNDPSTVPSAVPSTENSLPASTN